MGQAKQYDGRRGAAGAALASNTRTSNGQPSYGRRHVVYHDGQPSPPPPAPCFRGRLLFLFNVLSWDFFGRLLGEKQGQFQVRFSSQNSIREEKSSQIRIILGCILDSSLWNHVHQLIKPKFLLLFSFVSSYFFCLTLLIMFMFSLNVQFLY